MHTMQLKEIGMAQAEEIKAIIEDAFSAEPWQDDWHDRQQFDLYVADLVNHTNFRLKHGTKHSGFFVLAKLSAARRTGGTRERNEAKPDGGQAFA